MVPELKAGSVGVADADADYLAGVIAEAIACHNREGVAGLAFVVRALIDRHHTAGGVDAEVGGVGAGEAVCDRADASVALAV